MHGFDVVEQPRYVGEAFTRRDVRTITADELSGYDLIWASPPCQGHTAYKRRAGWVAPVDTDGFVALTRRLLVATGRPYIIENVPGAPLVDPVTLCGSMFGLDVRRHRVFETNFQVAQPSCYHRTQRGTYAHAGNRTNARYTAEIGVWRIPIEEQRAAMDISWMVLEELSLAIPPAYAAFLARRAPVQRS